MTEGFEGLEARLWAILAPYRDRFEEGSAYGLVTSRRPGARAHDFFAGVRVAPKHLAFHLMPIFTDSALLDGPSPALRKQLKGKTTFDFTAIDDGLLTELEGLTARSFDAYMVGNA